MKCALVVVLLAAGCAAAPRAVTSTSPSTLPTAEPTAAEAELRFPLPSSPDCSRGFLPDERHFALDIPAPEGTPVLASADGEVVRASSHRDYGLTVVLRHVAAASEYTLYAHLSSVAVAVGEVVATGSKIGEVGSTGNASGPHLHWEVLRASGPLPLRAEGPIGVPGDAYRVDPATVATGVPASCVAPAVRASTSRAEP